MVLSNRNTEGWNQGGWNALGWTVGGGREHSDQNEDAFAISPRSVVIMDGATGLDDADQVGGVSSARWLATNYSQQVAEELDQDVTIDRSLRNALDVVVAKWAAVQDDQEPLRKGPSASLYAARLTPAVLEFSGLGDCTALVRMTDGSTLTWHDNSVSKLDDIVIERMQQIASERGVAPAQTRSEVEQLLRKHRDLRNRPEGYWTLDLTGEGLPHATIRTLDVRQVHDFALMTDGFWAGTAISDFPEPPELLDALNQGRAEELGGIIERAYDLDPELARYPRLKPIDDMGVVYACLV